MKKLLLFIGLSIGMILTFSSCKKKGCTDADAKNYCDECKEDGSCVYTIKYEVTGSPGPFDVTIENASGGTDQYSGVSSGWYYTWEQSGNWTGRFLYVSAQNQASNGNVNVYIKVGNTIKYQGQCQGAYCIATANN